MLSATQLSLDNSFGLAAQAGIDYDLNEDWALSADLKYISIKNTTANFSSALGATSVDVDISPLVFGIGISNKF